MEIIITEKNGDTTRLKNVVEFSKYAGMIGDFVRSENIATPCLISLLSLVFNLAPSGKIQTACSFFKCCKVDFTAVISVVAVLLTGNAPRVLKNQLLNFFSNKGAFAINLNLRLPANLYAIIIGSFKVW